MVLGEMEPDAGTIYLGPSIKPGYYAQEFETLDANLDLCWKRSAKQVIFPTNRGVAFLKKYRFGYEQRDTLWLDSLWW
jgi:ATPase subunit of ABC transporter with duplicated ATPase domains